MSTYHIEIIKFSGCHKIAAFISCSSQGSPSEGRNFGRDTHEVGFRGAIFDWPWRLSETQQDTAMGKGLCMSLGKIMSIVLPLWIFSWLLL
jgi:hypothetical protein